MTRTLQANETVTAFLAARDFLIANRLNYERAMSDFRWPTLTTFNWALDYFDLIAAGNDTAALHIVEEDGTEAIRSFAELSADSNRVAHFLKDLGAKRGDRLMLMLGNEVALWETLLAAMKLGVVVTPATPLLTAADLQDRIERGRVAHIVVGHADTSKFEKIADTCTRIVVGGSGPGWHQYAQSRDADPAYTPEAKTAATDPMLLYFTSGTTSKPKLVMHTHQSYPVGHLSTLYWTGLKPGDRHWNISSPGWAKHAWSCFYAPWNAQATIFIYNYARFHATAVLNALVKYNLTSLCAPPTVWRMLIQEHLADYHVSLREVLSAGEPLNPEVIEQVQKAWGLTIRDGYGQTETTAQIGNPPGQRLKPGSMGRPLPGYPIVLLDSDDRPSDKEGEISLPLDNRRPLGLTDGYADDQERTSESTRGGYYHTGDIASRDGDGYLTFVGRADDVFKASDYRISPFELESVLIEHAAVAEAAVVPSPDPVRHAVAKAFIVLAPGYAPTREVAADIFKYCRNALAPYKRIRRLEFSDLPKTISGKIRRVELRAVEEQRRAKGERGSQEFWEEELT
jgi:acetyl-CoA synthetase